MTALDVAVVGAGPAGLAAGWALAAAGARVTLYERRAEPGGRMRTDELDGARVDAGVQLLGSYYGETFRLAAEAGARDLLVRSPGRDALWRGGRAHPLTYGSVASMAASGALPAGLKLGLATRYLPFLTRNIAEQEVNEPARGASGGADRESIAEWGHREIGSDFVELLAYPTLASYYGAIPEETSARFYHALARAAVDLSVHAARGGMGELARAIARAIEARGGRLVTERDVEAVTVGRDDVGLRFRAGDEARHAAVVLAVPAAEAARIGGLNEPALAWLAGVRTRPTATLALRLDRPTPGNWFGLSFPRTAPPGDRLVAVCALERKAADLVPAGGGLLVLFPAPAFAPRIVEAEAAAVADLLLPALERALPGIGSRVTRARVYRFPEGAVQFYPGYLEHLERFDEAWLPERLALAGDYLVAPTVEGAVRSGLRAAARLLRGSALRDGA
jgi:oxygen-dependent protoporphyrinogen oxidase